MLEELLDKLPKDGTWKLIRLKVPVAGHQYMAAWSEDVGSTKPVYKRYGKTLHDAVMQVLKALNTKEGNDEVSNG